MGISCEGLQTVTQEKSVSCGTSYVKLYQAGLSEMIKHTRDCVENDCTVL